MAIDITNLDIQDEFGNAVTDFSLLNVTDKVTLTYEIEVSEYAIASNDITMTMNYTNGAAIGSYWLYDPVGQFTNFKIGDVIEVKDRVTNAILNATVNVVDKLDNFTIRLDIDITGGGGNNVITSGRIFNIKTGITALKYFWNFIENTSSNDYFSKVDGSLQLLSNNAVSTSVLTSGVLTIGVTYRINDFNAGDDFANVGGSNVTGNIFTATGTTPTNSEYGSGHHA